MTRLPTAPTPSEGEGAWHERPRRSTPAASRPSERPSLPSSGTVRLARSRFTASIIPVLVGGACALVAGGFSPVAFLLCLAGGVALQAGTNLVNDYYDWQLGADHSGSLGPSRVIQEGWLSPRTVLVGGHHVLR